MISTPRVEINLAKIAHNAEKLVSLYRTKGINLMGVTKTVCGDPVIAKLLTAHGIPLIADSRLKNIIKMREAGIETPLLLLRAPALSEVAAVIQYVDISMNTELATIKKLAMAANYAGVCHKIILMVEMGDLREGIMPGSLEDFIEEIMELNEIEVIGIGANFACFGGVKPSEKNMGQLSAIALQVEEKFHLTLTFVSGGNSANYNWFQETASVGKINNLRLGESIYLGCETLYRKPIEGLYTDAFTFIAEIIEVKAKPSVPYGEISQDAFGNHPTFIEQGQMRRGIAGAGAQDVLVSGLTPRKNVSILGSSSDHTILDLKNTNLQLGDEVMFDLDYGALLSAMTSPYVLKEYTNVIDEFPVKKTAG